ncbi:MAG: twin-arginine translocase subunit TatC [Sphingomonadales bacterium]|nr:twin-arginine translocase subunit TatC [Sphingomonadales bacterium]
MAFDIQDIDETQAPLLDHLIELRARLLRAILALGLAFCVCLYFVNDIFGLLVQPLRHAFGNGQGKLIYTGFYEGFFVDMKVALFAAFFVSFPVIANQIWAFVAPGLYASEKKAFLPFLVATPVLFLAGGSLAYFVVMPTALHWLLGFGGNKGGVEVTAMPSIGDYLGIAMQFILVFGVSFLLPVLLLLLNRAGLVTRTQLSGARRYVIVGIVAMAAVLTPPDVASQLMLAIPMFLLFEGSLVVMWLGERKAAKAAPVAE